MTTWPVNYIEQDAVYQRLLAEYERRLVQATGVLVKAFHEPTQEEWENAYVAQTGQVPPILPGKLAWQDLRNGTVKSYTTIYKDNGEIDGTVRPLAVYEGGCRRLLGVTRIVPGVHYPLDVMSWIQKGLLFLVVWTEFEYTPVISDSGFITYTVTRAGAGAPSTGSQTGSITFIGTLFIFNPSTENGVPRVSSTSVWGYSASSAQLRVGMHTTKPMPDLTGFPLDSSGHIYGVFASDPGDFEEFYYE